MEVNESNGNEGRREKMGEDETKKKERMRKEQERSVFDKWRQIYRRRIRM